MIVGCVVGFLVESLRTLRTLRVLVGFSASPVFALVSLAVTMVLL